MANQEHVELLKQGVETWNAWRVENPDVIPDLSGADLNEISLPGANLKKALFYKVELGEQLIPTQMRKANLKGADLTEANLQWVDLSDADLDSAILIRANLSSANLWSCGFSHAHMSRANLQEARVHSNYFFGTDLTEANLQKADIYLANFQRANMSAVNLQGASVVQTRLENTKLIWADLRNARFASSGLEQADMRWARVDGADFGKASMGGTILSEVDLSRAKGLDEMFINSPLVIDFSALYKSNGQISPNFLVRAGIPEEMVDLYKSSAGKFCLIRTYIACTLDDHELMRKLKNDLIESGVACWPFPLDVNNHWLYKAAGIYEYRYRTWDRLIVICSREAFRHQYLVEVLNKEHNLELETGRDDMLIPICLDDETIAIWNEYNETNAHKKKIYDFRQWQEPEAYKQAFQELLDYLTSEREKYLSHE